MKTTSPHSFKFDYPVPNAGIEGRISILNTIVLNLPLGIHLIIGIILISLISITLIAG